MAVFRGVLFARLFCVVTFRHVGVMAGLFVIAVFMVLRGDLVMFRGVLVMLRGLAMVLRCLSRHRVLLRGSYERLRVSLVSCAESTSRL